MGSLKTAAIRKLESNNSNEISVSLLAANSVAQLVTYADHLVMMRDGQIVTSGAPSEVFTAANLKRVFDLDAQVIQDPETGRPVCVPRPAAHKKPGG